MDDDNLERIVPLLARVGISLGESQRMALMRYGELLNKWNRHIHLTGQRERLFSHHILDCSMSALPPLPVSPARAIDIGSGAGLPGVVLAILRPDVQVDTMDTSTKKVNFLQVVAGELGLANLTPRRADVREWMAGEGAGLYDIAVSRAFAKVDALLALGLELLMEGGELWAFKGRKLDEERALVSSSVLSGFDPEPQEFPYDFPETGTGGVIAVYKRNRGS